MQEGGRQDDDVGFRETRWLLNELLQQMKLIFIVDIKFNKVNGNWDIISIGISKIWNCKIVTLYPNMRIVIVMYSWGSSKCQKYDPTETLHPSN